jgi:hypothetical protein
VHSNDLINKTNIDQPVKIINYQKWLNINQYLGYNEFTENNKARVLSPLIYTLAKISASDVISVYNISNVALVTTNETAIFIIHK